jgi:hypothetical protein
MLLFSEIDDHKDAAEAEAAPRSARSAQQPISGFIHRLTSEQPAPGFTPRIERSDAVNREQFASSATVRVRLSGSQTRNFSSGHDGIKP